ncbi:hypothetical protein ACPW96_13705 [Micromonospora sp. DT81.3]|uniref:hypothetical protein n=1 Tax=Micromonospora sp. DT81.3 TaxID=3416523 RepID=UPI003CEAB79D
MTAFDGLVTHLCTRTVPDVLARLRSELLRRDIRLFSVVDHGQAVWDAGWQLHEEVVAIFGKPDGRDELWVPNQSDTTSSIASC